MTSDSKARMHGAKPSQSLERLNRVKTLMAMRFASRATPEKLAPLPAAMPATCVPCLQPSSVSVQLTPEPDAVVCEAPPGQSELVFSEELFVEKQASETTLPERNGCVLSTPVSRMATA